MQSPSLNTVEKMDRFSESLTKNRENVSSQKYERCSSEEVVDSVVSDVRDNDEEKQKKYKNCIDRLEVIKNNLFDTFIKIQEFSSEIPNAKREYKYLDEMLLQSMIKIDDIDAEGDEEVRTAKRKLLIEIKQYSALLDEKKSTDLDEESSFNPRDYALAKLNDDKSKSSTMYFADEETIQLNDLELPSGFDTDYYFSEITNNQETRISSQIIHTSIDSSYHMNNTSKDLELSTSSNVDCIESEYTNRPVNIPKNNIDFCESKKILNHKDNNFYNTEEKRSQGFIKDEEIHSENNSKNGIDSKYNGFNKILDMCKTTDNDEKIRSLKEKKDISEIILNSSSLSQQSIYENIPIILSSNIGGKSEETSSNNKIFQQSNIIFDDIYVHNNSQDKLVRPRTTKDIIKPNISQIALTADRIESSATSENIELYNIQDFADENKSLIDINASKITSKPKLILDDNEDLKMNNLYLEKYDDKAVKNMRDDKINLNNSQDIITIYNTPDSNVIIKYPKEVKNATMSSSFKINISENVNKNIPNILRKNIENKPKGILKNSNNITSQNKLISFVNDVQKPLILDDKAQINLISEEPKSFENPKYETNNTDSKITTASTKSDDNDSEVNIKIKSNTHEPKKICQSFLDNIKKNEKKQSEEIIRNVEKRYVVLKTFHHSKSHDGTFNSFTERTKTQDAIVKTDPPMKIQNASEMGKYSNKPQKNNLKKNVSNITNDKIASNDSNLNTDNVQAMKSFYETKSKEDFKDMQPMKYSREQTISKQKDNNVDFKSTPYIDSKLISKNKKEIYRKNLENITRDDKSQSNKVQRYLKNSISHDGSYNFVLEDNGYTKTQNVNDKIKLYSSKSDQNSTTNSITSTSDISLVTQKIHKICPTCKIDIYNIEKICNKIESELKNDKMLERDFDTLKDNRNHAQCYDFICKMSEYFVNQNSFYKDEMNNIIKLVRISNLDITNNLQQADVKEIPYDVKIDQIKKRFEYESIDVSKVKRNTKEFKSGEEVAKKIDNNRKKPPITSASMSINQTSLFNKKPIENNQDFVIQDSKIKIESQKEIKSVSEIIKNTTQPIPRKIELNNDVSNQNNITTKNHNSGFVKEKTAIFEAKCRALLFHDYRNNRIKPTLYKSQSCHSYLNNNNDENLFKNEINYVNTNISSDKIDNKMNVNSSVEHSKIKRNSEEVKLKEISDMTLQNINSDSTITFTDSVEPFQKSDQSINQEKSVLIKSVGRFNVNGENKIGEDIFPSTPIRSSSYNVVKNHTFQWLTTGSKLATTTEVNNNRQYRRAVSCIYDYSNTLNSFDEVYSIKREIQNFPKNNENKNMNEKINKFGNIMNKLDGLYTMITVENIDKIESEQIINNNNILINQCPETVRASLVNITSETDN